MPRADAPPVTRGVVLRAAALALAVALGGLAAWLIVTSTTQKRLELGVLAGLWAALVGAFSMFGSRRLMHPLDSEYDGVPGSDVALRSTSTELERAEDAAARRAHEARLEHMLRTEIHAAVSREVATLRAEIAELRSELLEKVGGQLRLERIETTRVIGSDLEALQHEVRQLKAVAQDVSDWGAVSNNRPNEAPIRQIVEPARVRPVTRETAEVEADPLPARTQFEPEPEPAPRIEPEPAPRLEPRIEPRIDSTPQTPAETTGPIRLGPAPMPVPDFAPLPTLAPLPAVAALPTVTPMPSPQRFISPVPPQPTPRPQPAPSAPEPVVLPVQPSAPPFDDFASLPRIRPFTDFELDPIEDEPAYTGRRRRTEDGDANSGRHARRSDEPIRRHRRADGGGTDDELLARLLAREGS
jgi:hypothetical protein